MAIVEDSGGREVALLGLAITLGGLVRGGVFLGDGSRSNRGSI